MIIVEKTLEKLIIKINRKRRKTKRELAHISVKPKSTDL